MNPVYDTQTPHIAAFVIIQNDSGKVAFVKRQNTAWMNGYYGLPSGKVEEHESFTMAAVREAKEEVGIDVAEADLKYALTMHRSSSEDGNKSMKWIDVFFVVKQYSGEVHNAESHMHSEVAWLDPDNLPDDTIPAIKEAIDTWQKGDVYCEFGW